MFQLLQYSHVQVEVQVQHLEVLIYWIVGLFFSDEKLSFGNMCCLQVSYTRMVTLFRCHI